MQAAQEKAIVDQGIGANQEKLKAAKDAYDKIDGTKNPKDKQKAKEEVDRLTQQGDALQKQSDNLGKVQASAQDPSGSGSGSGSGSAPPEQPQSKGLPFIPPPPPPPSSSPSASPSASPPPSPAPTQAASNSNPIPNPTPDPQLAILDQQIKDEKKKTADLAAATPSSNSLVDAQLKALTDKTDSEIVNLNNQAAALASAQEAPVGKPGGVTPAKETVQKVATSVVDKIKNLNGAGDSQVASAASSPEGRLAGTLPARSSFSTSGLVAGSGGASAAGASGATTSDSAENEIATIARKRGLPTDGGYGSAGGGGSSGSNGGSGNSGGEGDGSSALLASLLSPQQGAPMAGGGGNGTLESGRSPASTTATHFAARGENSAGAATKTTGYRRTVNYKMNTVAPRALQTALSHIQPRVLGSTAKAPRRISR